MKKSILILIAAVMLQPLTADAKKKVVEKSDREVWVEQLYQMAAPVLSAMAEGRLQEEMSLEKGTLELSPTWDGRDKKVSYMEAFGRLMAGLAPWLSLPDDDSAEGAMRKQLREWALKSYANAVDPDSPDYLGWQSGGQTLVDAAYVVESLYRGFDALWMPLDSLTKARYVKELQGLHRYDPPYTNWLLFVAMEECFLYYIGAPYDSYRIHLALNKGCSNNILISVTAYIKLRSVSYNITRRDNRIVRLSRDRSRGWLDRGWLDRCRLDRCRLDRGWLDRSRLDRRRSRGKSRGARSSALISGAKNWHRVGARCWRSGRRIILRGLALIVARV